MSDKLEKENRLAGLPRSALPLLPLFAVKVGVDSRYFLNSIGVSQRFRALTMRLNLLLLYFLVVVDL